MNKLNKILKASVFAVFFTVIATAPSFAAIRDCVGSSNSRYPNLSTVKSGDYDVKCTTVKEGTSYITIYGKSTADCAQAGSLTSNPDACDAQDLDSIVRTIINTVIFVVGMVAVVMIILGGVNYATSQGDPGKVNKAKSTIMYGIIGLVICLLAFAIVNFVLQALTGNN